MGLKNPCFFVGFPCLFPKKQGKEGQGYSAEAPARKSASESAGPKRGAGQSAEKSARGSAPM